LTFYEFDLLVLVHRRMQEREDRRAALTAWIQVEMNRDTSKRTEPFSLEELVSWLGHGFQEPRREAAASEPEAPGTEELMQKALSFVQMFGEKKITDNGAE
jgi:hypothetical protein